MAQEPIWTPNYREDGWEEVVGEAHDSHYCDLYVRDEGDGFRYAWVVWRYRHASVQWEAKNGVLTYEADS